MEGGGERGSAGGMDRERQRQTEERAMQNGWSIWEYLESLDIFFLSDSFQWVLEKGLSK